MKAKNYILSGAILCSSFGLLAFANTTPSLAKDSQATPKNNPVKQKVISDSDTAKESKSSSVFILNGNEDEAFKLDENEMPYIVLTLADGKKAADVSQKVVNGKKVTAVKLSEEEVSSSGEKLKAITYKIPKI